MKKTVKNLLLSSLIALAANFGTGCSNGGSDGALAVLPGQHPIETPAEKPESRPENEPQNSDYRRLLRENENIKTQLKTIDELINSLMS